MAYAYDHQVLKQIFPDVLTAARRIIENNPACHDWDHTQRVLNSARHICTVEKADCMVVDYAAVLHDIGRPQELQDQGITCHAEYGAGLVPRLLADAGIRDHAFTAHVASCVRTHRYRRRDACAPETLEAQIVFDADKLDCIGAIGIGRSFHFAGRIGARVHNTSEEARGSASYSTEDSAYREYLVKLRYVHDRMLTEEGRRMAEERHRFMVMFFERINREVRGEDFLSPD